MTLKTKIPALFLLALAVFANCDLKKVDDQICDLAPQFTFPGDTVIAIGDTLQFADASTGSGLLTYNWFFGDGANGSVLTAKSPIHVFGKKGEFEVRLTIVNGECPAISTSRTFNVIDTTIPPPVAKIMVAQTFGDVPWTAVFQNQSTGQITEQEWDFGDNTAPSFDLEPSHTYLSAATFRVVLKVVGPGGAIDRDTVFVEARPVTFVKTFDLASGNAQEIARLVAENPAGGFWVATNDNAKTVTASIPANGGSSQTIGTFDVGADFSAEAMRYGIADANGFSFTGVAHFDAGGANGDDFYLLRLDKNFNQQTFQTIFDDINDGNESGYGVTALSAGGMVACGRKSSIGTNLGMYFTETLPNGTINRVAHFSADKNNTAHCIVQRNGGYAVAGRMLNGAAYNACLFTLNSSLASPSAPVFFGNTTPTDLVRLPTGGFLMLLREGSSGKLVKLSDTGAKDWELALPDMTVQRIALTIDGNAAVVGWQTAGVSSGAALVKVNLTQKNVAWQHNYLKTNLLREGHCLAQLSDGGFLVGGSERDAAGIYRTLIIRTDATGMAQE